MTFKRILLLSITLFSLSLAPAFASESELPAIENEQPQTMPVTINVSGSTVHISNANGMTLQVVSLTGSTVASVKIDSNDKRVELNLTKGCYILKVGKVVRKISIR